MEYVSHNMNVEFPASRQRNIALLGKVIRLFITFSLMYWLGMLSPFVILLQLQLQQFFTLRSIESWKINQSTVPTTVCVITTHYVNLNNIAKFTLILFVLAKYVALKTHAWCNSYMTRIPKYHSCSVVNSNFLLWLINVRRLQPFGNKSVCPDLLVSVIAAMQDFFKFKLIINCEKHTVSM